MYAMYKDGLVSYNAQGTNTVCTMYIHVYMYTYALYIIQCTCIYMCIYMYIYDTATDHMR